MPKVVKPLSQTQIDRVKLTEKNQTLFDGDGLFLLVKPSGVKLWRFFYNAPDGRRRLMSFGKAKQVNLEQARARRAEAHALLKEGKDPQERKTKGVRPTATGARLQDMAEKLTAHMVMKGDWSEQTIRETEGRLRLHIYPIIPEDKPVNDITRDMVMSVLDRLQGLQKHEALQKTKTLLSQIFQHAVDLNVPNVQDWTKTFKRKKYSAPAQKHRAALTKTSDVAGLMRAIESYREINIMTALAMKFSAMTFLRPKEVRMAEWPEFDLPDKLWIIPGIKMKKVVGEEIPHLVPLAPPVLEVLAELKSLRLSDRWLFPGTRQLARPMSEATVLAALRRMGYEKTEMCAHGFRGTASTLLNAHGFPKDIIERQLAHRERNRVRSAYNHYDYLQERRRMMDWWAGFLIALQNDNPPPPPEQFGGRGGG